MREVVVVEVVDIVFRATDGRRRRKNGETT
jgi:hypothetical protein